MLFLSVYTAAVAPSGPPSPEHIAHMMKLIEEWTKAGVLVTTGGLMSRNTGMKVTYKKSAYTVEDGPVAGSSLMPAAGFALLRVASREELVKYIKAFLEVAGDGHTEIIQVLEAPPNP